MSERKQGTFLVTDVDDQSAVLRDVDDGQVHTLSETIDVEAGDVLDATLAPKPPLEVTWTVVDREKPRSITVKRSNERPTKQARDLAADQAVGELTREERAGIGELHVITVSEERTDEAADDVIEDETTVLQAARIGVDTVEIRAADGVVSVRYLP